MAGSSPKAPAPLCSVLRKGALRRGPLVPCPRRSRRLWRPERRRSLVVQTRRATGREPGARIVCLSGRAATACRLGIPLHRRLTLNRRVASGDAAAPSGHAEGELHGGAGIGDCALMRLLATWAHACRRGRRRRVRVPGGLVAGAAMTTRHGRPGACRRRRALSAALAARHCHQLAAHDVEQGGQLHVHAVATDGLPRVRRPEARITCGHSPRPARLLRDRERGHGFEVRRVVAVGRPSAAAQRWSERAGASDRRRGGCARAIGGGRV
jgi:hypothetical protein